MPPTRAFTTTYSPSSSPTFRRPAPDPQPQPAPSGAWTLDSIGWWYRNADGTYPANTSAVIDGRTYRFDGRGYMRTGWVMCGAWYYLSPSGAMVTGTQDINGRSYTFNASGVWIP